MALWAIVKAELLIRERVVYPDGALVEMVVWRLPKATPPSRHRFVLFTSSPDVGCSATITNGARAIIAISANAKSGLPFRRSSGCWSNFLRKSKPSGGENEETDHRRRKPWGRRRSGRDRLASRRTRRTRGKRRQRYIRFMVGAGVAHDRQEVRAVAPPSP